MNELISKFLFPKTFIEKRNSMEWSFFGMMASYAVAGMFCFFALTGLRVKTILLYPILVALLVVITFGLFYLTYFSRKMAIASREAGNIEQLRKITLFFQKRAFQLFHLPLICVGIVLFKMDESLWSMITISIALFSQMFMLFSEWKLIFRKFC